MSTTSIQKQEENQSEMTPNEKKKEVFERLFNATMGKKWTIVEQAYKNSETAKDEPRAWTTKLTKSEQTALHIAVSCYNMHSEKSETHLDGIKKIVNAIPEDKAMEALRLKDTDGNTPLHLAARHGSVSLCEVIASNHWRLIESRNDDNETPLFLAAHRQKIDAFFCLLKIYQKGREKQVEADRNAQAREGDKKQAESPEQKQKQVEDEIIALCRAGKDGRTILHSAISGEDYKLAYRIIQCYPKLVDSKTVDGESPLHVLARKPNSFKSSSHLRFYDSIIYHCLYVPVLKKENCDSYNPDSHSQEHSFRCPRNFETCIGLYQLLYRVTSWFYGNILRGPRKPDEESGKKKQEGKLEDEESGKKKQDEKLEDDEDRYSRFPANYGTLILIAKFMTMSLLIIFGLGHHTIKKMREKKERHKWAAQIMNEMIKLEREYKYDADGQAPIQNVPKSPAQIYIPTDAPPTEEDSDTGSNIESSSTQTSSSAIKDKNGEKKIENVSDKKGEKFLNALQETAKELNTEKNFVLVTYDKEQQTGNKRQETPFLIAAKTGITEMVEKILDKIEVAINDVDENNKNALLLAVEHRQTKVFHCLLDRNLPESVIHQVDREGNSARHLSALFRPNNPWRLPGDALQMHGEVTWFKHVKKRLPPLRFSHYNKNGETPRDVFRTKHEELAKAGTEWLIKTSESCSVVAALIATVAFATSVAVPGGVDDTSGEPILVNHPLFNVFSVSSLVALCFSLTALVFFLAIITSRCQVWDFKTNLPRKLLMGLSCLFTSIAAILVSFCAGHFFVLAENLQYAALPIYAVTSVPLTIFFFAQLPLYFDLMRAVFTQVPVRSYKVFYR